MNLSSTPFKNLNEFELSYKLPASQSLIPENESPLKSNPPVKKSNKPLPLISPEMLKSRISNFYTSTLTCPIVNYLSWMEVPKVIDQNLFYDQVKRFSYSNADTLEVINHSTEVFCLIKARKRNQYFCGCLNSKIYLWNAGSNHFQNELEGHTSVVVAMALTPDDQTLISGSYDKTILLRDLNNLQRIEILGMHDEGVVSLACSPNGQLLASGSDDKSIIIWDLNSRNKKLTLQGHSSAITITLFLTNETLISSSWDTTIRVWDLRSGTEDFALEEHKEMIRAMVISPDSRFLCSGGGDKVIRVWDLKERKQIACLVGHVDMIRALVMTADGSKLISAGRDKSIRIWDFPQKLLIRKLKGHTGIIRDLLICEEDNLIMSAGADQTIRVWSLDYYDDSTLRGVTEGVSTLAMSSNGRLIFGALKTVITVWNAETLSPKFSQATSHKEKITVLLISKDDQRLFSAGFDSFIEVWDLSDGKSLKHLTSLHGHKNSIASIRFSSKGQNLVSGGSDNFLIVWNIQSYEHWRIQAENIGPISCLEISMDGEYWLTGTLSGLMSLWKISQISYNEEKKPERVYNGHDGKALTAVKITTNNQKVISASVDSTIKIWKASNGNVLYSLNKHRGPVVSIELNEEGTKLISGSEDGTIRLWDVRLGLPIGILELKETQRLKTLILSPDGVRFVVALSDSIKVWQTKQLHILKKLENVTSVNALLLIKNQLVVTGSGDGLLRVWKLEEGFVQQAVLEGHTKPILVIKALHEAPSMIVSGSEDYTIRLWDLKRNSQVKLLKGSPSFISSLAVFTNDTRIISGCFDGSVRLWDFDQSRPLKIFKFHAQEVKSLQLFNENSSYVSGGKDTTIKIVDLKEGSVIHTLIGHEDAVNCLIIIDSETRLISGSKDKTIRVWSLLDGHLLKILKSHRASVTALITNLSNTKMLSGAEDGSIHIWDLEKYKKCNSYNGHEKAINNLAMVSDETRLISVGSDQTMRLWRLDSVDLLPFLEGHSGAVIQITNIKNDRNAISISEDNTMILWDIKENKPFRKLVNKKGEIKCFSLMNNQNRLLLVTSENFRIWDLSKWNEIDEIESNHLAEAVLVDPEDRRCFIGCEDTNIEVWDLEKKALIKELEGHLGAVKTLACAKNRSWLISGSADTCLIVWDMKELIQINIFKGHSDIVKCVLVDQDEKWIVSGSYDRSVMVWRLDDWRKEPKVIKNLPFEVRDLVFTPSQDRLIVGMSKVQSPYLQSSQKSDDFIQIFTFPDLNKIPFQLKTYETSCLSILPSGQTLLSGSLDHSIYLWDLSTLSQEKAFPGFSKKVLAELMTPDNQMIILACDDNNILVWNLKFTILTGIFRGHKGNPLSLKVNQDCSKLVSGAKDMSIRVWSLHEKREITILEGHSSNVNCLEFFRNETILLSGSDDLNIRVWDFSLMKLITVLDAHQCVTAILELTQGESFLVGDKENRLKIWQRSGEFKFQRKRKQIALESSVIRFIVSPNRKLVLILLANGKIQCWKIDGWLLLTEIEGMKGNLITVPSFLSSRFIIYFNKIIDCFTGEMIFSFQVNYEMQSFFYDVGNSFFYFLTNEFRLRKLEKSWLQNYFFDFLNYSSMGNLPQDVGVICAQQNCTFPFGFNFLHLISIFDKGEFFTLDKLKKIYGDNQISLQNFYQIDSFKNTPLDILILKKNPAFILKYFDLLFTLFSDEATPFYQKIRFLNYDFSKKDKKNKRRNILDLICELLQFFEDDISIITRLLEISFMELDPNIYDNDILYEELKKPLFIEFDEIYTINKETIGERLKEKLGVGEKTIYEKASRVRAKFLAIPQINDITNKNTSKILEHFSNLESDNEAFSSDVLKKIVNHIWRSQIWFYYLTEFIVFAFCFITFNINHIFLMPIVNTDSEVAKNQHVDRMLTFFDSFLIFYSLFYAVNEIKQMASSGIMTYFKNVWNYFDISLIPLLFVTSILNILVVRCDYEENAWIKLLNSACMFSFWFRCMSFFRAIKETSSMMRLIFNVVKGVKYFVLFMVFFWLTLASTFYLLHGESDSATYFQALFAFYKSTVGDSSGITEYTIVFPGLTEIFMIASTFLFAIILLNLLVAIIGDKHQDINDAEEKTRLFELTNIVVDCNSNLVTKIFRLIRKPKKRGNYLIYLFNESQEKNSDEKDAIEAKIEGYIRSLDRKNERLIQEKIEELEEFFNKKIEKLKLANN